MPAETLVLCIDRDDDVGRKGGVRGPIIGRKANIAAATALALADPEDSDSNTIFEAVRTHDVLKKEGKRVEVATVTGDRDVGVRSDTKIAEQLTQVIKKTGAKKVILVTDGLDDEQVIPLVQNRAAIIAMNRVVMKQSERLEGMYYMIHDFIDNPKMSKIFLGLPALALLLIALFGVAGWRLIVGGLGIFLLIKGFKLEATVSAIYNEFTTSLQRRRATFFFYVAAMFVAFVGLKGGYDFVVAVGAANPIETAAAFIRGSVYLVFAGFFVAIIGRASALVHNKRGLLKYLTYGSMGLSLSLIAFEAAGVVLTPESGYARLFISIAFGFALVLIALGIERFFGKQ